MNKKNYPKNMGNGIFFLLIERDIEPSLSGLLSSK